MSESTPPETRPADYDAFAFFYDRYWGSGPRAFASRVLPALERLLLQRVPPHGRILDLCCGSGLLAYALSQRGFHVTGVDGSQELLRYARERAPGVEFIHADARALTLPQVFAGAVSLYDSLNHIMRLDELTLVFRRLQAVLQPGARFLFDLNMEEGYRARWRGSFAIVQDDHVLAARSSFDPKTRAGATALTMFRVEGGAWRRSDLTLHQRCYTVDEVRGALSEAGFGDVATYDAEQDLGMTGEIGRTFFVAVKP